MKVLSPCKMISPHSAAYVSEMRKVSSESDSIVGFGEEGNATRHYTEVRFQFENSFQPIVGDINVRLFCRQHRRILPHFRD